MAGEGRPYTHSLDEPSERRYPHQPSAPALRRRLRRPGSRRRARLHEGHRVRRRRAQAPDDRHRQHLDRGDALQLPPARPRRAHQGGRSRGGRDADGVQHDRDLGRDHDGHGGHEELARQPRGDRRLDRADRARLPVRRDRRALCLRQDHPGLRDGARAPRHPVGDALRRLDRAGPLQGPRRDDPRRLRGDRRPQRRHDDRGGADRARGRREPRRRRMRSPVHRQHDGLRVRGARDLARRLGDGSRRGGLEDDRRREDRRARHAGPRRGPQAEPDHHEGVARERDRLRLRFWRLDERGAPPPRGRPRGRHRPRDRRLRADLAADAALRRPQAGRPLRRHGPLRRGRRAPHPQPPLGGRAPSPRPDHGERPDGGGGGRRGLRDPWPGRCAPRLGPAEGTGRPRDPARQPRARRRGGQGRRNRAHGPDRPGARLRARGGRLPGREERRDQRRRHRRYPQRRARPAGPACARCSR